MDHKNLVWIKTDHKTNGRIACGGCQDGTKAEWFLVGNADYCQRCRDDIQAHADRLKSR